MSIPYGTGSIAPSEAVSGCGIHFPRLKNQGVTRTAIACPQVRAGSRMTFWAPLSGSIIETWLETASVYHARPF
jgi:hypothetical protein